ncbi:oxygenase MpaB family protein [Nocardia sp. NPDC051570]|uniref:oxygenase MpaB family protein n=1 Tax=Nocardia sp. NPDC051570 TaxID=3364324 RepID=UPI00378FB709
MTCPVNHSAIAPMPIGESDTIADRFVEVGGSIFIAAFAAALFDQAMLPEVSEALEVTGRIRDTPWQRALRSAASDQAVFHGTESDRLAEMERLKLLHRDVRGVGANGIRYSALNPESWNWILISTFFMYRGAFATLTGTELTPADDQALWDRWRAETDGLQLPGRSRLMASYADLCAHYDRMATQRLARTSTLESAAETVRRPPRPPFLPAIAHPLWLLARPAAGHIGAVLGYGIMHPAARQHLPMRWTRRHELEFAVLATGLRLAYRALPTRLTDSPLARNRREYHRLMNAYRGIGLDSFAPDRTTPLTMAD